MQRDISNRNSLGDTFNPIDDARRSTAIDRTTSTYNDAKEKVQKLRDLVNMGNMMLTWQNIFLDLWISPYKECLTISTLKKKLPIPPTKTKSN